MKNIAIISYNIHCNFTNYGSALQSWALSRNYSVNTVLCAYIKFRTFAP